MAATSDSAMLETVDLTPLTGSELKADLAALLGGRFAAQIRETLERRGVLVVRGAPMDDAQQAAFGRTLGEPDRLRGQELLNVSLDPNANREADYFHATVFWHMDQIATPRPHLAIMLTPRRLPEAGGETEFANAYAAWEALPEAEKQAVQDLRVVHALEASLLMVAPEPSLAELERWRREPIAERPLVWTHRSGRKSLVVGSTALYVVGKSPEESRHILTRLREWTTQRRFVYQHRWRTGDLVVWDNTGVLHRVLPYPRDSGRLLRRTALRGEECFA
jgi:alpha-ketoglutarate-dependent taurine dioxygenase